MSIAVWDAKSHYDDDESADLFDCMLAEHLLAEGRYSLTLENAYEKYGVSTLEELKKKQEEIFSEHEKINVLFRDVEMPLVKILWQMEKKGITLDGDKLRTIGREIDREVMAITIELQNEFGTLINLSSPAQVGSMLVAKFQIPLKKTASGQYSTGERELAPLAPMYPVIEKILRYRELTKLKTTYIDSLISKIAADGKIHTTYNQASTITGRLSSSNPNLQNIPSTGPIAKQIKSCFTAREGHTLISFDYSQQELRILAHISKEEALIEAFRKGMDVHKQTAAQLFSVPYESVTKEQRYISKTINFGIIYGMGSFGLSQTLAIPVDQAATFIDNFYKNFPRIKEYYDRLLKDGLKNNYVETILGRRRYVLASGGKKFIDNATRRELMNFPIQGSAADLVKKAMVQVDRDILSKNHEIRLLLQIHDELVFEVKQEKAIIDNAIESIQTILANVYPLSVPMEIGINTATNWGDLK